jgi:hypothetical protein
MDGLTIRGTEIDMSRLKAWARRHASRERIALATAEIVVAGYAGIVLARILQSY